MQNTQHFADLIPLALRSVPYIFQSHLCKGYVALENLYAQRPHWPDSVWAHCVDIIRHDEPKVDGLIAEELLDIEAMVDRTSGRDFGPDWILGLGLMPLSYWAMRKKHGQVGFEGLFREYFDKALNHPTSLGHELSVLSGYWQFYGTVFGAEADRDSLEMNLFLQRFTEFVVVTFAGYSAPQEPPVTPNDLPSARELLEGALTNPGFFGHNLIAAVWGQRIRSDIDGDRAARMTQNLKHLNLFDADEPPKLLTPLAEEWSEGELDEHLIRLFLDGPTNIHQITLADALLWVWNHHPEHRRLCGANILCFTERSSP